MDTMTERLERLAELQKKNIEPLQHLGGNAFSAFERMARKNYELMGDMVEYAVAQSRGSVDQASPQAIYEHQMSEARAFAERMSARAAEYMVLAEQLRSDLAPDSVSGAAQAMSSSTVAGATARAAPNVAKPAAKAKASPKKKASTKASAPKPAVRKVAAKKTAAKKKTASTRASASKAAAGKATAKKRATTKKTASRKAPARKRTKK